MPGIASLSKRHQQIAALVAQGLSNKEVAARVGVATGTINTYMQQIIYPRLGLASSHELIRWWILNVEKPWESGAERFNSPMPT